MEKKMPIRTKIRRPVPGLMIESPIIDDENAVHCVKCGCTWLEQVLIRQYDKDHLVILGQQVQPATEVGFWILKCIKCGDLMEPNVQSGPQDMYRKGYDKFLNIMEEPDKV